MAWKNDETGSAARRALIDLLRPAVRAVRRTVYRLAWPWRRRRALELVRSANPVRSVAFICLGNICRSPYAAQVALRKLQQGSGVRVLSAGLLRGGRPSPSAAIEVAAERGHDLEPHVSRGIDRPLMDEVDLLVVMDPRQKRALITRGAPDPDRILILGDLDPSREAGRRTITDPYGADVDQFRETYDRIDRCMQVLLETLEPARSDASEGADVADASDGAAGGDVAPARGEESSGR